MFWISTNSSPIEWGKKGNQKMSKKQKESNLLCFLFLSSLRKHLWKKWCNNWEWWLGLFPSQKRSVTAVQPCASSDCPQRRNWNNKERATPRICNLPTPNLPRTKRLRTQRQQKSLHNSDFKETIFFLHKLMENVSEEDDTRLQQRWRLERSGMTANQYCLAGRMSQNILSLTSFKTQQQTVV